MKASFRGSAYSVVFTDHAKLQIELRGLSESDVLEVIETGEVRAKGSENKFWVYKRMPGRKDNMISVAISIEDPRLIVITAMVNWRPQ